MDKIKDLVLESSSILILAHINPDGDAIGSALSLYNVLLERYNLIPNESVFIDDNKNNIETGNSLGIISKKVEPDDYYSIIKIIKEFNLIQGEI